MKTKQSTMKAVFTSEMSNGVNYGNKLETVGGYKLIDKKTESVVVDCRIYTGRSRDASQVKATIWITLSDAKKPATWEYHHTSGTGTAGGWGYCKTSSAVASAISDAGIELFGSVYGNTQEKVDFKKRVYFGGSGEQSVRVALLAIANAAGFNDCVFVEY
jgi:hypothetical protein